MRLFLCSVVRRSTPHRNNFANVAFLLTFCPTLHVLHRHGVKKRSCARLGQTMRHQQTRHCVNFPLIGVVWTRYCGSQERARSDSVRSSETGTVACFDRTTICRRGHPLN
ncbi:hypothetical protein ARMGADRAFT_24887 [Armillaria gallica]|uniref:Uncharacterized protein n=1 Tax=Armillaria gallica TaxID=47427 RepID=A0A2H3EYU0_ARMGA|nr:hypothetical protein ARMGADRAFT_24887 [Armillaria gallica]